MPCVLIVRMVTLVLNLPKFNELSLNNILLYADLYQQWKCKETITDSVEKTLQLLEKKQVWNQQCLSDNAI